MTFGVVLSVCTNNSSTSKKSGLAYADYKPSDVTAVMVCTSRNINLQYNSGAVYFNGCATSDSTSLESSRTIKNNSNADITVNYVISWGDLVSAGFRPCSGGSGSSNTFLFCK